MCVCVCVRVRVCVYVYIHIYISPLYNHFWHPSCTIRPLKIKMKTRSVETSATTGPATQRHFLSYIAVKTTGSVSLVVSTVFVPMPTSQYRRQDVLVGVGPLIRSSVLKCLLQDDYYAKLQLGGLPSEANRRSASYKVPSYGKTRRFISILTAVRRKALL